MEHLEAAPPFDPTTTKKSPTSRSMAKVPWFMSELNDCAAFTKLKKNNNRSTKVRESLRSRWRRLLLSNFRSWSRSENVVWANSSRTQKAITTRRSRRMITLLQGIYTKRRHRATFQWSKHQLPCEMCTGKETILISRKCQVIFTRPQPMRFKLQCFPVKSQASKCERAQTSTATFRT